MIAYLGTGLLGSGFVKALLKRGEQVNVWNRTIEKAAALAADGAVVFEHITDAVKGVARVHLTLKDDESVDEVLNAASGAFTPGLVIIDHTTTSVAGAIARTKEWQGKGFTYIHAPVFMGPINALECSGYMLVSGDRDVLKSVLPELDKMTGKVLDFGIEIGRAAAMKLAGNHFLIAFTAGISDTLALTKAMGVPSSDLTALFNEWNPGAMLPARLKRIVSGQFDNPSWELQMARKDAGLMINEASQGKMPLVVLPAIVAQMDECIAEGDGNKDWSVISKNNL